MLIPNDVAVWTFVSTTLHPFNFHTDISEYIYIDRTKLSETNPHVETTRSPGSSRRNDHPASNALFYQRDKETDRSYVHTVSQ